MKYLKTFESIDDLRREYKIKSYISEIMQPLKDDGWVAKIETNWNKKNAGQVINIGTDINRDKDNIVRFEYRFKIVLGKREMNENDNNNLLDCVYQMLSFLNSDDEYEFALTLFAYADISKGSATTLLDTQLFIKNVSDINSIKLPKESDILVCDLFVK